MRTSINYPEGILEQTTNRRKNLPSWITAILDVASSKDEDSIKGDRIFMDRTKKQMIIIGVGVVVALVFLFVGVVPTVMRAF